MKDLTIIILKRTSKKYEELKGSNTTLIIHKLYNCLIRTSRASRLKPLILIEKFSKFAGSKTNI